MIRYFEATENFLFSLGKRKNCSRKIQNISKTHYMVPKRICKTYLTNTKDNHMQATKQNRINFNSKNRKSFYDKSRKTL